MLVSLLYCANTWHAALEFGVWFAVQEMALRKPQQMHTGIEGKEHLAVIP